MSVSPSRTPDLVIALLAALVLAGQPSPADWRLDVERWREEREAELLAENGWLSVAGLYWLEEGESLSFGSGAGAGIRLRPPTPALAGRLERDGEGVRVSLEPGVAAGGRSRAGTGGWRRLGSDADGDPVWLSFGPQRFHVIRRGERFGVRLIDDAAPTREHFQGLRWYPVSEEWRISARFFEHPELRELPIADVTGATRELESPGYAVFELRGREVRLHPVLSGDPGSERLFFVFRDATSGSESYGAGRFLYASLPENGVVELDFNRAYSPPCAFTLYATCPLPPRLNWLDVAIEAGEKDPKLLH